MVMEEFGKCGQGSEEGVPKMLEWEQSTRLQGGGKVAQNVTGEKIFKKVVGKSKQRRA